MQVMMLVAMKSHDQKSHIVPHFDYPELRNAMLPLMMLFTSCDITVSANGITWPKKSHCTSFQLPSFREFNGVIEMLLVMWCHCWCQWHYMTKIGTSVGITCCTGIMNGTTVFPRALYWNEMQYHFIKMRCNMPCQLALRLHLILIILTKGMHWCHWQCHQHHVMPMPVPIVSYEQRNHIAPHFDCPDLRNEWCHWQCHLTWYDPKSHIAPHFNIMPWEIQCFHSWCQCIIWCWHWY